MTEDNRKSAPMCMRCLIAGRVQGVFFRANTRHQAQAMGIHGYARNLPDGRVEVLACGEPEAVSRLKEWLRYGPADARVSRVSCEIVPYREHQGFTSG